MLKNKKNVMKIKNMIIVIMAIIILLGLNIKVVQADVELGNRNNKSDI